MSILRDIVAQKRQEIQALKTQTFTHCDAPPRSFIDRLTANPRLHLIAEVKQASPSKGIIYSSFDPVALGTRFEAHGASCISVLTDERFFKGHATYLTQVKSAVSIPILRKDFILDPIQVRQSQAIGANVILLILDILSVNQANELIDAANDDGLEVLIEIHSMSTLDALADIPIKPLVGVNNRDLHTFSCDTNRSLDMAKRIRQMDASTCIVAESGYDQVDQLNELESQGLNGVLIGEGLSIHTDLLEWFKHEN